MDILRELFPLFKKGNEKKEDKEKKHIELVLEFFNNKYVNAPDESICPENFNEIRI